MHDQSGRIDKSRKPIEQIDLSKAYVSNIDYGYELDEILTGQSGNTEQYMLSNSIYVGFLEQFKDQLNPSDEEIHETEYYISSHETMNRTGICRQNKTEKELLAQCRYFLNLYKAIKEGSFKGEHQDFAQSKSHSRQEHPFVSKIENSEHVMIVDGHHRLACHYVLGRVIAEARITGIITPENKGIDHL